MDEKETPERSPLTIDWLVRGVLTKAGDALDRFTGRGWKPSSSLATSELVERLKTLLDAEARHEPGRGTYVPHNIKLKMQWDKFSTDSDDSLRALETELLVAAVDHINDRRYYTYAPLKLEVRPDYFTSGVKLLASFEKFADDEDEAEIALEASAGKEAVPEASAPVDGPPAPATEFTAVFDLNGQTERVPLRFGDLRRLSVGRTRENDLPIPDTSVSRIHASIVLNADGQLVVSDTGSTNGTYVLGERIPYGRAVTLDNDGKVVFGSIEVSFERVAQESAAPAAEALEEPHAEAKQLPFATSRIEIIKAIPTGEETAVPDGGRADEDAIKIG
ncbi:MAG: FHA domain-containing protein [Pyrinomonadaceae bacterium]